MFLVRRVNHARQRITRTLLPAAPLQQPAHSPAPTRARTGPSSPTHSRTSPAWRTGALLVSVLLAVGAAGVYRTQPAHMDGKASTPPTPPRAPPLIRADNRYHSPSGRGLSGGAGLPTPLHPLLSTVPPSSLLPPSTITSILSLNAVITPLERGHLSSLHSNFYNANPSIEDSFAVEPLLASGGALLGMFDGHSGSAASVWCKRHLLHYLQAYRARGWTKSVLSARPFLDADAHFLGQAWRDGMVSDGLSGACVNVVHVQDREVTSANAGDCRAIIGRRVDPSSPHPFPSAVRHGHQPHPTHVAVELSQDHQIDVNPAERERLLREHPGEDDVLRRDRVKGRLQPTRGFGDGAYKTLGYYRERLRVSPPGRGESSVYRPPYTTVEPDVWTHRMTDADDFLVLSTDGAFSDLSSQEVIEYVSEWMDSHPQQHRAATAAAAGGGGGNASAAGIASSWLPSWFGGSSRPKAASSVSASAASALYDNVSTFLISRVLLHASEKQIGRRGSETENLSWTLRLPMSVRRNVHDDISILVLFFDHSGRMDKDEPVGYDPPLPGPLQRALDEGEAVPGGSSNAAEAWPVQIQSKL